MFSGIALANLAGAPLGTWLGHELGWRATFLAISVLGVVMIAALATLIPHLPTLASAINIGAFNLGNAVAAWLAGFTIAAGLGLESAGWVGALMTLAALILAFVSVALMRREARNASTASTVNTNTDAAPQLADASRA